MRQNFKSSGDPGLQLVVSGALWTQFDVESMAASEDYNTVSNVREALVTQRNIFASISPMFVGV